jgi:uncharacterized protein (TIGR02246 family)
VDHKEGEMDSNDRELHGIDLTFQEWALAFAAGDSERLVSLVTADAEFWSQEATPILGRTALRETFDEFFAQFSAEQRFIEVERLVQSDWAIIRGLEVNTLTPAGGSEVTEVRQRAFSVLRCENDGRWRFARGMTNQGPIDAEE